MVLVQLSYQVMGIGKWTQVNVTSDVAEALVDEYEGYGWPVKVASLASDEHDLKLANSF